MWEVGCVLRDVGSGLWEVGFGNWDVGFSGSFGLWGSGSEWASDVGLWGCGLRSGWGIRRSVKHVRDWLVTCDSGLRGYGIPCGDGCGGCAHGVVGGIASSLTDAFERILHEFEALRAIIDLLHSVSVGSAPLPGRSGGWLRTISTHESIQRAWASRVSKIPYVIY